MQKFALCIDKKDAPEIIRDFDFAEPAVLSFDPAFFDTPTRLIDRAICEKDESTLQLLPYVFLSDNEDKIFCYSRGAGGAEDRLKGKLSIGLGGHMDFAPAKDQPLEDLIESEAQRELNEESGLPEGQINILGFVVANDEVARVHLGILLEREVTEEEKSLMTLEHGIVERGQWMTIDDLKAVKDRLELWSRAVLNDILDDTDPDYSEDPADAENELDFGEEGHEDDQ